ncbi:MAG: sulfatase-like hydrolase/transferase, partial [Balneolales bacterium]|nr:sulfatase-like hydrolase/transferase [Balneolales bacterium]
MNKITIVKLRFASGFLAFLMMFGTIQLAAQPNKPKNIVFILSDDHRFDFMGFHPDAPSYIQTPNLDRMAEEGVHIRNAFVTTSLCSP